MNGFLSSGIFILLGISAVSLLILGGYAVYKNRQASSGIADEAEPTVPEDKSPSPEQSTSPRPPKRHLEEIAHLWRDTRDGKLIFQVGDQHYKHGTDLNPRERKILLKVVMDFYHWLEPPSPRKSVKPEDSQKSPQSPVIPAPEEAPPTRVSPTALIANALQSAVPAPPPPAPSIVTQIDGILQEKLKAANMQKLAVRLVEFPDRGMVVMVGLEQYNSIEEVPYKAVKSLIREAVADWERSVAER